MPLHALLDAPLELTKQANAFVPGWGQTIFQTANEMAANIHLRKRTDEIQAQSAVEKAWWDERRAGIQSEFLKELDGPGQKKTGATSAEKGSDEDAVLVEPADGQQQAKKKKSGKK